MPIAPRYLPLRGLTSSGNPSIHLQTNLGAKASGKFLFGVDVMPDEEHFLMLEANPAAAPELRVIRNWAAELKATVGN